MPENSEVDQLNWLYDQMRKFPMDPPMDPALAELLHHIIAAINEIDTRQKGFLGTKDVLGSKNVLGE
jgi:hypothetical protein